MFKSKWILTAILLCTMLPLAANATITRVIGLGGANSNYIIKDAANPQIWPQLTSDWPNLAGAEFFTDNGWDFQKAYLNYSFADNGSVVQVAVDKLQGVRSMFYGMEPYTRASEIMTPSAFDTTTTPANTSANKLSLSWGMPLEGGMKIGAAVNVAEHSFKSKGTPALERNAALYGVNLGFSALDNALDLAAGFEAVSLKNSDGAADTSSDGSMAINVAGRYWWNYGEKMALVPNVRFLTMKDADKATNFSRSLTHTVIKAGIGHNWTPVENTLAIFEVGFQSHEVKHEDKVGGTSATTKMTSTSLPYWRLGFETKVFSWLNGRLGAERLWVTEKSDAAPDEPEAGYSTTQTYLGATAHWDRLFFDLLISPDFVKNGPNFISGNSSSMFARVSLKYDFNK